MMMKVASIARRPAALLTLAFAACAPRAFSYTVVATTPEPAINASFRQSIREWIKQRFSTFHVAEVEAPNIESFNLQVRHCRDADGTSGCNNLGKHSAVVIDSITFMRSDTAYARVRYFVNESDKPALAFTETWVRGIREPAGTWTLKQDPIVSTGTIE
jgi:hypothetical protein